jgi:ERF superfamily
MNKETQDNQLEKRDNSPAEMIRIAVTSGADLEKLKGLLDLQERWEANEARKAFQVAMAAFKSNPPNIGKDKKVSFGNTKYSHASLYNVVEKITTELSKHGLSAAWSTHQNGQIGVTCKITHVLGHSQETTLQAPADTSGSKNAIQAIGSTISYLQRYSLLAVLGLAAHDMDDDGAKSEDLPISEEQIATLKEHMLAVGANEEKFLKFLKVERLDEVLQSQFTKAVTALKAKGKKK